MIGKLVETSYLLPYRYQFHVFTFMGWFILEIDLVVFDILLANLSTAEIIAIYGIMMIATYMLFTIALAGLRKLMYAEILGDTLLNKIAKFISLYGMAILGIGIIIKHILGNLFIRCFNFHQGIWLFIAVDLL